MNEKDNINTAPQSDERDLAPEVTEEELLPAEAEEAAAVEAELDAQAEEAPAEPDEKSAILEALEEAVRVEEEERSIKKEKKKSKKKQKKAKKISGADPAVAEAVEAESDDEKALSAAIIEAVEAVDAIGFADNGTVEATEGEVTEVEAAEGEAEAPDESDVAYGDTSAEPAPKVKQKRRLQMNGGSRMIIASLIICALIVAVLGVANAVTKNRIRDNSQKNKEVAVLAIFDYATSCEAYKTVDDKELFLVYRGKDLVGYAVIVSPDGHEGKIEMAVGIDAEYRTAGVEILSMSESAGIGTKIKAPEFLNKFIGGVKEDPLFGVDTVAGATVSSSAVCEGVLAAHEVGLDLEAIAEGLGVRLLTRDDLTDSITSAEESAPAPETQPQEGTAPTESSADAATTTVPPKPVETEDIPGRDYGDGKHYSYNVDSDTADDKYVIEISKEDATATVTETETKEPEKVTTKAETTKKPEPTKAPETTKKPETTKAPETTKVPETTKAPETTPAPETTMEPETTPAPETTAEPETTKAPETTKKPIASSPLQDYFGKK